MNALKALFFGLSVYLIFGCSHAMAIDLYGFGSYWDKEDADGSWGAGLGLSLPLFTEHLRLDGRAYFFEDSDDRNGDSLSLTPLDLGLQVHLLPSSKFDPYVLGGVSYIYSDADKIDFDSGFGGYVGGGADWAILSSAVKLFGEVVYRFSELEQDSGSDIDISGLTANVGLKFHF